MIEPFTIMTTAALTEAVKLLMSQGQKLLGSLRRRKEPPVETIAAPVLRGELTDVRPDLDRAGARAADLEQLLGRLGGYIAVEPGDDDRDDLAKLVDAARSVLEEIYNRSITFAWEQDRPPSGTRVDGSAYGEIVRGKLVGVRIGRMTEGDVTGTARAGTSEPGSEVIGVEITDLGR